MTSQIRACFYYGTAQIQANQINLRFDQMYPLYSSQENSQAFS